MIKVDFHQSYGSSGALMLSHVEHVEPYPYIAACSRKASRQVLAENGELVETAAKIQV